MKDWRAGSFGIKDLLLLALACALAAYDAMHACPACRGDALPLPYPAACPWLFAMLAGASVMRWRARPVRRVKPCEPLPVDPPLPAALRIARPPSATGARCSPVLAVRPDPEAAMPSGCRIAFMYGIPSRRAHGRTIDSIHAGHRHAVRPPCGHRRAVAHAAGRRRAERPHRASCPRARCALPVSPILPTRDCPLSSYAGDGIRIGVLMCAARVRRPAARLRQDGRARRTTPYRMRMCRRHTSRACARHRVFHWR